MLISSCGANLVNLKETEQPDTEYLLAHENHYFTIIFTLANNYVANKELLHYNMILPKRTHFSNINLQQFTFVLITLTVQKEVNNKRINS